MVRYFGSTIVLEDEACFCQFEASSVAAVAAVNRRADLPFDRIVPAVLVQPTNRSGEMSMSISTSIPKAAGRRRSRLVTTIAAIAAVLALAAWAVATYAIGSGARPVRSNAPTQASVLRHLTSAGREYVLGIASMTPAEVRAAFGTNPVSLQGRDSGSGPRPVRSGARTLAAVLRSLPPRERRYVLGIASLTPSNSGLRSAPARPRPSSTAGAEQPAAPARRSRHRGHCRSCPRVAPGRAGGEQRAQARSAELLRLGRPGSAAGACSPGPGGGWRRRARAVMI